MRRSALAVPLLVVGLAACAAPTTTSVPTLQTLSPESRLDPVLGALSHVAYALDGSLYAVKTEGDARALSFSDDAGRTWSDPVNIDGVENVEVIDRQHIVGTRMVSGAAAALVVSEDGGATLLSFPLPPVGGIAGTDALRNEVDLHFTTPDEGVLHFCPGGANGGEASCFSYPTEDGGRTWGARLPFPEIPDGYPSVRYDDPSDPAFGWIRSTDGIAITADGGRTWRTTPLPKIDGDDGDGDVWGPQLVWRDGDVLRMIAGVGGQLDLARGVFHPVALSSGNGAASWQVDGGPRRDLLVGPLRRTGETLVGVAVPTAIDGSAYGAPNLVRSLDDGVTFLAYPDTPESVLSIVADRIASDSRMAWKDGMNGAWWITADLDAFEPVEGRAGDAGLLLITEDGGWTWRSVRP